MGKRKELETDRDGLVIFGRVSYMDAEGKNTLVVREARTMSKYREPHVWVFSPDGVGVCMSLSVVERVIEALKLFVREGRAGRLRINPNLASKRVHKKKEDRSV